MRLVIWDAMGPLWRHCSESHENSSHTGCLTGVPVFAIIIVMLKERWGNSNHRQLDCLSHNVLMRTTKTPKVHITGPLWGESTGHRWFPAQKTSNTERATITTNVSIKKSDNNLTSVLPSYAFKISNLSQIFISMIYTLKLSGIDGRNIRSHNWV